MQDKAIKQFSSYLEYYTYVMERYFRLTPPVPTHVYLGQEAAEDASVRVNIAKHCKFPPIINILANDENEAVRNAARNSEYWQLIGRYQDILGFQKSERRAFARIEGQHNILVLLMFEDDPDIIKDLLANPAVSLKMLVIFLRIIKTRGKGRKDEQIYEIARSVLKAKKEEIVHLASIKKAARQVTDSANIRLLLNYLHDDDRTVRRAAVNALEAQDAHVLRKIVQVALEKESFKSGLTQFVTLSELIRLIHGREDLRQVSVNALQIPEQRLKEGRYHSIADFFLQMLKQRRINVVKTGAGDLTDFNYIVLLAFCHIDADENVRILAEEIMPLRQILNLVNDVSTPRKVFKDILSILEGHRDETVTEDVRNAYLNESRRLKESLKELEFTVQAYFDIIFQSLGYHQINEHIDVVRSISLADKQMQKFNNLLHEKLGDRLEKMQSTFTEIEEILRNRADVIYFDISPKVVRELDYIQSIINEIFDLKEMGLASLRPGTPEDIESEMKARARLIWQSAISTYLGRIKDLSEMIRKKLARSALTQQIDGDEFEREIRQAELDLETSYKKKVACHLTIRCIVCSRRGCAAERFLRETHFFIKEFLDNFADDPDAGTAPSPKTTPAS